ncbi:hypothetical protein QUA71_25480 [Microcoleus sp. MON1_C5]|uniref:hypothetical protein n=1 Tax=Microcoleus sp. MON1_C5 TaxID=2818828 RepID=UPI002FD5D4AE
MNSEQSTVNSQLEFTIPMLTDLISLDIRKWECPNAALTMIETSMQLKTLEIEVYEFET